MTWEHYAKRAEQSVPIADTDFTATVEPGSWLRVHRLVNALDNESGAGSDEADIDTGYDIDDLQAPVGAGETLYFEAELATIGDTTLNLAVIVRTPPHPNGGFQVIGNGALSVYKGGSFGADDFNYPVAAISSEPAGTLKGYGSLRIQGVLANGEQPGLLKLQLAEGLEFTTPSGYLDAVVLTCAA